MKDVFTFLKKDNPNPPNLSEFQKFWKACTDDEREQFATQARSLM